MDKESWISLHPVQQAILWAMAKYEEEIRLKPLMTYKVRRLIDYSTSLFSMNEGELIESLYKMAREKDLVHSQGNVGCFRGDTEYPGACPEFVEVALTEYGKSIIPINLA